MTEVFRFHSNELSDYYEVAVLQDIGNFLTQRCCLFYSDLATKFSIEGNVLVLRYDLYDFDVNINILMRANISFPFDRFADHISIDM
jgi:hypothetical protein